MNHFGILGGNIYEDSWLTNNFSGASGSHEPSAGQAIMPSGQAESYPAEYATSAPGLSGCESSEIFAHAAAAVLRPAAIHRHNRTGYKTAE